MHRHIPAVNTEHSWGFHVLHKAPSTLNAAPVPGCVTKGTLKEKFNCHANMFSLDKEMKSISDRIPR